MFPTKLEDLRALLAANLADYTAQEARLDTLVETVEARADKTPTPEEAAEVDAIRVATAALREARTTLTASIADAEKRVADRAEAETLARSIPTPQITTTNGGVQVRSEEKTYRKGGQHSFFRDLYARDMRRGDRDAEERLYRHEQELKVELRDTVISGLAGMVPPQYLVDDYAPIARAGRPLLNSLIRRPLPNDGIAFVVPRGTTVATGGFVTEGASFIEVDTTVANDTPEVQLIGAFSDVSRTVFERGGSVVDDLIFPDLIDVSEVAEDRSAIVGTAAPGFTGILASVATANKVAYTDASPTVPEIWPKIADAIQRINSARFMPATAIFMHPRRWSWFLSALDTSNRPLIVPAAMRSHSL